MKLERVLKYSQLYNFFFAARAVEAEPVVLGQRRVFILPTLHGFTFALALILMLIGSVNYQLALGFMLTFLLTSISLVSIVHAFRNLAQIEIRAGRTSPVFAGQTAQFAVTIENRARYDRFAIAACRGSVVTMIDAPAGSTVHALLDVPTARRGWLALGRLKLETRYPLGLCRAWGYALLDQNALVYPTPIITPLPVEEEIPDQGDMVSAGPGADDFAGLRPYQSSDSPRHIAWKAMARTDALPLTKQFSGYGAVELWLDWDRIDGVDSEARLSRLTGWVIQADASQRRYGLRIPGTTIQPDLSPLHRDRCLKALALYGLKD